MIIRNILAVIAYLICFWAGSKAYATWSTSPVAPLQFYVASTGSDTNNGTSPATPWATLANVNSGDFPPNSVINLMTNLTACFNLNYNNTPGPLTIQSFGGAQVTVTCAAATQNFGTNYVGNMFDGINGITINNIKFVNPNNDAGTYTQTGITTTNYQFGILFQNSLNPNPISVTFINNVIGGYSNDVGFMYPNAQTNFTTCGQGFNGVTIEWNTIGGTSTSSKDAAGVGFNGTNNEGGSPPCNNTTTTTVQNVTISYNEFKFLEGTNTLLDNGPFGPAGIMVGGAQNITVSYNYVHDIGGNDTGTCPGSNAIWTGFTSNMTWTHNEVARVGGLGSSSSECDSHGINPGVMSFNNLITDNFVHDTNGSCFFLQAISAGSHVGPGWSATVADNICENARWAGVLTQNNNETGFNIQPALIYNNTFVLSGGQPGFATTGSQSAPTGSVFKNNVMYAPYLSTLNSLVGYFIQTPDATATTFDYNDYFDAIGPLPALFKLGSNTYTTLSAWQTACSCDSHSTFADPQIISEPLFFDGFNANGVANCSVLSTQNGASLAIGSNGPAACPAMMVYNTSPAFKTGVAGLTSNPVTDYYGNNYQSPPNMGASQTITPGSNIKFDTSVSGTATTLSLTTAGQNELIFAGAVTNSASSCTVSDGASLTWTSLGAGGSGTSIVSGFVAFSAAKLTSDTITFTCSGQTFMSNAALAFSGATGVHDLGAGLPMLSATNGTISSIGANGGVDIAFVRLSTSTGAADLGFTSVSNANFLITEYQLINIIQSGVPVGSNRGTVADVWH